jgi:hypothetical protein
MKTMIPNEVRFGIDLNDLPARVTQVSSEEALSLTGGSFSICRDYTNTKKRVVSPRISEAKLFCEPTCRSFRLKYSGQFSFRRQGPYQYQIFCNCCT